MKTRYFQIKYGFGVSDSEVVKEQEVEKAIYAQIKGVPIQLNNSYINGRNIIAIRPAYFKHTGWHDWYEPTEGEDWEQIKRDCPSYDGLLEAYKERVATLITNGQINQIGKGEPIIMIEAPKSSENKDLDDDIKKLSDNLSNY
jgi:hypothetical protein